MAPEELAVALSMIMSTALVTATTVEQAPAGSARTLYCMHVEPITGSNVQTIQCWTRDEWADQGVDVDKEWAKNGVRTIG